MKQFTFLGFLDGKEAVGDLDKYGEPDGMKKCSRCNRLLPLASFQKASTYRKGVQCICRRCAKDGSAITRAFRKSGLYETLLALQGGGCAICGRSSGIAMHVDHDHKTDMVRGILCSHCNQVLGKVRDNIETLYGMIRYLSREKLAAAV